MNLTDIVARLTAGGELTGEEAYALTEVATDELCAAAEAVTQHFEPHDFDACSIINARSGLCSEDCHWCAQSTRYSTGCKQYAIVDRDEVRAASEVCASHGIRRLSLVASGRATTGTALDAMADALDEARRAHPGLHTCASLGLLGEKEMERLREAGVSRYHCNLETAPSFFGSLCTTHTTADKIRTLRAARAAGLDVCSGGIIGMGETERQRVELALTLREVRPVSIPINILCPIPGTPLEHAEPLGEEAILRAIALFRLVHPRVQLRFAGGRHHLSPDGQIRALRIGINGAIVGDLLTTVGSTIAQDKALCNRAGRKF